MSTFSKKIGAMALGTAMVLGMTAYSHALDVSLGGVSASVSTDDGISASVGVDGGSTTSAGVDATIGGGSSLAAAEVDAELRRLKADADATVLSKKSLLEASATLGLDEKTLLELGLIIGGSGAGGPGNGGPGNGLPGNGFDGLSPAELARLSRRCVDVMAAPGSYDRDLVQLCAMVQQLAMR